MLPEFAHCVQTYESETQKIASVWSRFTAADLHWAPDSRSAKVGKIFEHELLSQRRFFGEFLGLAEPAATSVLPAERTPEAFRARLLELAVARHAPLEAWTREHWLEEVDFFGVRRSRVWIFWRRILHSAHHRTQLTVYLRLLGRKVPAVYGPSADETWERADPTEDVSAAGRR
jgi:uncharacterized damage-inducible protein DinB